MTEFVYREISAQKAVNGPSFTQGVIDFNFQTGSPTAWVPSKSYFRMSLKLNGRGNAQPTHAEQLAFADNAPSCLFNNVYFRAGGQDVSSIVNYVPQAQSCKTRLQKTGAWMNSTGKSAYMIESDHAKRVNQVSKSKIELIRVGDRVNQYSATVAIVANAGVGDVTGVNTEFVTKGLLVGDKLVVSGVEYTITAVVDDVTMTVTPAPAAAVAATNNVYAYHQPAKSEIPGDGYNKVFAMWQPPLGIFDHDEPLGSGDFRIQLNPNSDFQKACIQAASSSVVLGTDYSVEVVDIKFYLATVKMSIPQGVSTLHLMECLVQSKQAAAGGGALEFTVPSSTRALTLFFQDNKAGSGNPRIPPTRFVADNGGETTLSSFQLTYANCTKPSTRWNSAYDPLTSTNQLQQRYLDTQIESGMILASGGTETFREYIDRGLLIHYSFDRDSEDRSTQVQLSYSAAVTTDTNVFLVAWHSRVSQITTSGGSIQEVKSLMA